jgi:biotin-(acetyl-CoA carboxylase) ligase
MSLRPSVTDRAVDLPPLYRLVTLREAGDAFEHACAIAAEAGAGTLVWVRRFDVAEFAVVLEPEEPLGAARRAVLVGMTALADALAAHAPPERPIAFDWPDAVRVDGVLVGGVRLAWPADAAEDEVPAWLVFAGMLRTIMMKAGDPGFRPLLGSLDELGFEAIDAAEIIASFSRYFMAGLHDWADIGFARAAKRWLERIPGEAGTRLELAENGDLVIYRGASPAPVERRSLRDALATPSWRDPATGMPWL